MHYIINTGKPKANDCYLNTAGLNTTAGCAKMCILPFAMRITGLEPARRRHQILNLARLPIPPYPHYRIKTAETLKGFRFLIPVSVRGFEPRTT